MAAPATNARPDRYEEFVALYTRHETGLRAFVRTLAPTWDDVDEIMQNTSLVLWRKFDVFEPGSSFASWACTVARFEALKHRRRAARDRIVLAEDVVEKLADEAADDVAHEAVGPRRRALDSCLGKLPAEQRQLLAAAYAPGRQINEVAEELGKTATAFYKALNRIRGRLLQCIERRLASDSSPATVSRP